MLAASITPTFPLTSHLCDLPGEGLDDRRSAINRRLLAPGPRRRETWRGISATGTATAGTDTLGHTTLETVRTGTLIRLRDARTAGAGEAADSLPAGAARGLGAAFDVGGRAGTGAGDVFPTRGGAFGCGDADARVSGRAVAGSV